jgi:hypothetical protein
VSTATLPNLAPAEYHADRERLSHSQLEVFLEDPALYAGRFLTGEFPVPKPSAAMELGSAIDALIFGGVAPVEIPPDMLAANGAKNGKAWQQFRDEYAGRVLLKPHEMAVVSRCVANILAHPKAAAILKFEGQAQRPIVWTDEITGQPMRSLLDYHAPPLFVCDLKSSVSSDPAAFARRAYDLGHVRQAEMYLRASEQLTGARHTFVWIVVATEPPYTVETLIPDAASLAHAAIENRDALDRFAECKAAGVWRRSSWGRLTEITAPKWARST